MRAALLVATDRMTDNKIENSIQSNVIEKYCNLLILLMFGIN